MKSCYALLVLFSFIGTVSAKEVIIGFGISKPPYVIEETLSGLDYDIVGEALKASGHIMKASFAPQSRGELYLESKEVDGAATKRRGTYERLYSSDDYIEYHNYAVSLKSKPLPIKKISDLGKYSVRGFQTAKTLLGPEFKAMADLNPKYSEVADQQMQIAQLFGNRVDVVVGDIRILEFFLEKLKNEGSISGDIKTYDIFPPNSYVVMFHDSKLRDSFNKGLAKIRSDGTYAKLIKKYSN